MLKFPVMFELYSDQILMILIAFFAATVGVFMFYRAGKHDLIDGEIMFDSIIVGFLGGLIGGRITDFLLRPDFYNWDITKLIFFNVYHGFDIYGAVLGGLILVYSFLKHKRQKAWLVLDYSVTPVVLAFIIYTFGKYLLFQDISSAIYVVLFIFFFWALKRLEKERKFGGYFVSLSAIVVACINILMSFYTTDTSKIFNAIKYNRSMSILLLIIGIVAYYLLSKNSISLNLKSISTLIYLFLLKVKKLFTNIREANLFAKTIILLPLTLAISISNLVKLLGSEVLISIKELLVVFGIKNDRY